MQTSDFDYNLPEELIAQTPLKNRSSSRLLVLDRESGSYTDRHFSDILDYLKPGDALILNETKVLPARINGFKAETYGAVELLLLKDLGNDTWQCLARPQKRLKKGTKVYFGAKDKKAPEYTAQLVATVLDTLEDGITNVQFKYSGIFLEILEKIGTTPLPPYIHKKLTDESRYQTVYANKLGSAAAPTAGLHFTPELLQKIEQKGIKIVKITLNVGLGTFRPVQVEDIKSHQMHTEEYEITEVAAKTINEVKQAGGRIFAVGTTSVRTLETVAGKNAGKIVADKGKTNIFIYPGYNFQIVDALITNFHLPKSTLIMLVSAFSGRDFIIKAYQYAISKKYRFFSFGDAMLIV